MLEKFVNHDLSKGGLKMMDPFELQEVLRRKIVKISNEQQDFEIGIELFF